MRRIKLAQHPKIVDQELGVREYWFEGFRRAITVFYQNENCIFVSVDLYREISQEDSEQAVAKISIDSVEMILSSMSEDRKSKLRLLGIEPKNALLVLLRSPAGVEVIGSYLTYCDIHREPSYNELWELYRQLVMLIENRDPEIEPLTPPTLPYDVIKARLKTVDSRNTIK